MTNKNIDGIKKQNSVGKKKPLAAAVKTTSVDGIVKRQRSFVKKAAFKHRPSLVQQSAKVSQTFVRANFVSSFYSRQKLPVMALALALFLAFGGGMWFALDTASSKADVAATPQVLGESTDQPSGPIPLPDAQLPAANSLSNDVLFNTPIQDLKNYLAAVNEPNVIAQRSTQLAAYLTARHSPFAQAADTMPAQPHWQLIMAIAFAESTFGKNCNDNNCSNIGVKPGAPSWRHYASYKDWVIDFNRLLDKRYKDWTLEQMCGVYVKPCTANWLAATKQILGELKDQGIE